MNKRSIDFDLTIGSRWEDDRDFPQGGEMSSVTVHFETDGKDPYTDAVKALRKQLGREDFHIYYWWWL